MSTMITLLCDYCKSPFERRAAEANYQIKNGSRQFCSRACFGKNMAVLLKKTPVPNVRCAYCDIPFYRRRDMVSRSKTGLFFCCRAHKDLSQRIGGHPGLTPSHYGTGKWAYRRKALELYGTSCQRCGFDKLVAIEVHHKDRDRENCADENLEVLCANCHLVEHRGHLYGED